MLRRKRYYRNVSKQTVPDEVTVEYLPTEIVHNLSSRAKRLKPLCYLRFEFCEEGLRKEQF